MKPEGPVNDRQARRAAAGFNNAVQMNFAPAVRKPPVPGIPRYSFSWDFTSPPYGQLAEAEVDADKGEVVSLYYDNELFWNKPPPIDVPISARPAASSKAPLQISTNPVTNLHPSPPSNYVKMPR